MGKACCGGGPSDPTPKHSHQCNHRQIQNVPLPPNSKKGLDDDALAFYEVAVWLRNEKKSGLLVLEGQQHGKRVEFFGGEDLVNAIRSNNMPRPDLMDEEGAEYEVADALLALGYFHRSDMKSEKQAKLVIAHSQEFAEEEFYTWVLPKSQTGTYLMSFGTIFGSLAFCMIKIWPLWLIILVWWISMILLVTLSSIMAIRIFVNVLCWSVGFRGVWLFPNMFDDELGFLESFTPLIARCQGPSVAELRERDRRRKRRELREQERAKKEAERAEKLKAKADKMTEEEKQREEMARKKREDRERREREEDEAYEAQFSQEKVDPASVAAMATRPETAVRNLVLLLLTGVTIAYFMGVFDPENVPEFVVTRDELFRTFPSLAPPEAK
eukprot:GFYU01010515.1.p1 GENE.GFYU01010515.1~~GFYU01010515.1.p1  ORF type:complete len:412 (-),score=130.19 GFYU01010515.1:25-1176(-)